MKAVVILALLGLFQLTWATMPVEHHPCENTFSKMVCDGFNAIDDEVMSDNERTKRQLPGGLDGDILEQLLKAKLNFLMQFGLLKHIPFVGKFIHDIVERDPQGVAAALKGGIFGILQLVGPLIAGGLG